MSKSMFKKTRSFEGLLGAALLLAACAQTPEAPPDESAAPSPAAEVAASAELAHIPPPGSVAGASLERGEYLFEHVLMCVDCHSERDWSLYAGPVVEARKGAGALLESYRSPIHAANITPAALGDWSDEEIARTITSGQSRDGRILDYMMSSETYAQIPADDIYSVVAYLRTLAPVEHAPPKPPEGRPPEELRPAPVAYEPSPAPAAADTVARGRSLVVQAECDYCHGFGLEGGYKFQVPGGELVVSSNLTPSQAGLGERSRENFIGQFQAFLDPASRSVKVAPGEPNTVMPWLRYASMSEEDLGSIYDYLRTLEPVEAPES